jgi:competence protein ComEC
VCAGIITSCYAVPGKIFLSVILILILTGFAASLFFNNRQSNILYGFTLTLSLFLCGQLLYKYEKSSLSEIKRKETLFYGTLADYPEEKENSIRYIIRLHSKRTGNEDEQINGSILVYGKQSGLKETMRPGDLLIFRCLPIPIENKGNPCEFDYRFFMENQHIKYYSIVDSNFIISQRIPQHRKLVYRALITREKIIGMFRERGITGDRLALVSAITLGQKRMLDQEQKQIFMKAGIMHIMAVSGLHAVILSMFVLYLLFFMKRKFNILRVSITILVLWAFAFITGLTPSVIRATLMFSFLQTGKLLNRPSNGVNSLLASALFLIIIKPSVIFDAGFLLSYSAVIFIIIFYHDFYNLLCFKNRLVDKIWQSAAVTIIAQAGTLPLTVMLFNRFPTYFMLANITIVPLSNLLIIVGCLVPLFFKIAAISGFFANILSQLTLLTETLTRQAASLPYSTIENIGFSVTQCVLLFCTIFLLAACLLKKNIRPVYPAIFLLLFVIAGAIKDIKAKTSDELIVYNTQGVDIGVRTGKILNLFSESELVGQEIKRHCSAQGLKIRSFGLKNNSLIKVPGKKILVTDVLSRKIVEISNPDIIIVTGPVQSFEGRDLLSGKEIIFLKPGKVQTILKKDLSLSPVIYVVRTSGAYVKHI